MSLGQSISLEYFRYRPVAGHMPDCPAAGTDMWEATCYLERSFRDEVRETRFRFACHDCGVVHFEKFDGESPAAQTTHASQVGYASRPEKVAGLWLHPGPRSWPGDDRGPTAYYVTRAKARPKVPGDAIGVVGWHLGPRGGIRWGAGLDPTDYGTVASTSGQDWPTRQAAVKWIAAQVTS